MCGGGGGLVPTLSFKGVSASLVLTFYPSIDPSIGVSFSGGTCYGIIGRGC